MGCNLTLIENEVLDEILEKAIAYDILNEHNKIVIPNDHFNKDIMLRKANFLSRYVTIPLELDETIADKLEEKYDN